MRLPLLTVADVGRLIGRTPDAIRKAANAGRIKVALRTEGGVRLFALREVGRFALLVRKRRRPALDRGSNGS